MDGNGHPAADLPRDFGRHNMAVVGRSRPYLSHLPMFMAPHDAQLVLEAEVERDGQSLMWTWSAERSSHPEQRLYTMMPDKFPLSSLYRGDPPTRSSFGASFFRGHLERGGEPITERDNVTVNVRSVIHAEPFRTADKPDELTYFLFGGGPERYLAHVITAAPDFDQLLSVRVGGSPPSDEEIGRGVQVVLLDRPNTAASRVRDGEVVTARGHVTGAHRFLELEFTETEEIYFEEGELMSARGAFEPTPLETEAGFGE